MNEENVKQEITKHYIPPYTREELLRFLEIEENWQNLCPSTPYMCHDDNCGCRKSRKFRDVLR